MKRGAAAAAGAALWRRLVVWQPDVCRLDALLACSVPPEASQQPSHRRHHKLDCAGDVLKPTAMFCTITLYFVLI